MKVVTSAASTFDLGATEATPTVTLKDYSRRVTDDFGVTTVVPRGFSRQLSVRLKVPASGIDALQRRLTDLRATPARWVADPRYAILSAEGFYKDFTLDIPNAAIASCTLTVEGLTETDDLTDTGGDPAPSGRSTLRMLRPITVTDAALVSSSVTETDYAVWSSGTSYGKGARVILAATHRIYESAVDGNAGNDPSGTSGKWLNIGPTNRWAMFDQALGSTTDAQGAIAVTLAAPAIGAVALLDVTGASVRVQTASYDRTTAVSDGAITFLDLPSNTSRVTVTITGPGAVSVGTLLAGSVVALGATEASPTAGITDYSRKETDDFGEVTVVPRAWAKRMEAKAAIATAAIDNVFARIAAVRATPVLWIGGRGLDALTIYGFFKAASIEVGKAVSKLSLSIEGLSTAGKVEPFAPGGGSVAWPDITDPTGTKPANNATNSADPNSAFGPGGTVGGARQQLSDFDTAIAAARKYQDTLDHETIPAINKAVADAGSRIVTAQSAADAAKSSADSALTRIASEVTRLDGRIDTVSGTGGYDDTNLKAEVTRVDEASIGRDAALGSRVDTVSASLTSTDTNIRALIQTKEQAAVDRENAISKRVDDIIAEGGGGGDGTDTIARAEIQRVEQASTTRDSALGSRVDTIQAGVDTVDSRIAAKAQEITTAFTKGDQALASRQTELTASASAAASTLNPNPDFSSWSNPAGLPDLWEHWGAVGPIGRIPNPLSRGGYAIDHTPSDTDSGLYRASIFVGNGWYVMTATVWKTRGTWNGAGVTLNGQANIDFMGDPDTGGRTGDSIGDGGVRTWTKLIEVRDDYIGSGYKNWHAMGNWVGFGRGFSDKTLRWMHCGIRPATDAEVRAMKADAALNAPGGVLAKIKTTEDTLADLPNRYAAASRTDLLEAQVNGENGSRLLSRAESRATALVDGLNGAVNGRMDIMVSEYNGIGAALTQQAGVVAGIDGRTAVYWSVTGTTPDGSTMVRLSKADGSPGQFYIGANLFVDGNAIFNGTVTIRALDRSTMTATTSGSVAGTYGGAGQGSYVYIPNLGADMAIRSGGSIYITFTGNLTGQTDASGNPYPSVEILNAADNSVLASLRLPTAGFGNAGRLDNYVVRILNVWGDLTIRWRVANRATDRNWSIVSNPALSVYWTAL